MAYFEWDKQDTGNGGQFLKLEGQHRVRPVGNPIVYQNYFEPIKARSPGLPDCPMMQAGYTPKARYCYCVLDRNDEGKCKLMDFPGSVLDAFRTWKVGTGIEPHDREHGGDWSINVIPGAGGDKRKNRYQVQFLVATPLTPDEVKRVTEFGPKAKLEEFRGPNTPDEIRALMRAANVIGHQGVPVARPPIGPPTVPAVPTTVVKVTQDLTDW